MSIVFFATGEFAIPALEAVAAEVALVVTQPDRPSGRGMRLQPSPVKLKALELGITVETPEKARDPEFVAAISAMRPDFLLVAAYGQILSETLLNTGKRGGINLHGSILPKYRGAAPIQRAILNGDDETGVTLMQMDKGMDTGDMIAIEKIAIGLDETYGALQARLGEVAAEMIGSWLPKLKSGEYPRIAQDKEGATIAPKVKKEEAQLHFTESAPAAYNRFRAFTPAPGAFFHSKLGRVRVSAASLDLAEAPTAGTILLPNKVAFEGGLLELIEVQPEGKKRMSGRDFFNGARLRNGDSLL